MREVVSTLFTSVDGVAERPDQWQFDFDDEMGAAFTRIQETSDTILLGRVSFQEWSGYWPTAQVDESDKDFADWINNNPKHVFSTTLNSVDEWSNSILAKGSLKDYVTELKQQPGKNIAVGGSPTLVRSLVEEGLLDRLELLVHPVVAGSGYKPLFTPDFPLTKLRLVDAKPTPTGVIIATYQPHRV